MTKIEVERYLQGAVWRLKQQAQFDYSLAELFGISVARVLDSSVKYPEIHEIYPALFEEEAKEITEIDTATTNSMNNFLAFAMKHNAKLREGVETNKL